MKSIGQCGVPTTVLPTTFGPDGRFQDGTPGYESTTATQLIAEFLNSHLEEFANLIGDALSEDFSDSDDTQILRAVNALVGDLLVTANEWEKAQHYDQTVLTISSGAVVWDMKAAPMAVLILTDDVTSFTMSNAEAGATYELTVLQDATGSRSLAWPSSVLWPGGSAMEVSAAANSEDLVNFSVRDASGTPVIRAYAGQDFQAVS